MGISEEIITSANPPNNNIDFTLQFKAVIDLDELAHCSSDYDFWSMIQDISPDVIVMGANMEHPKEPAK